MSARSQALDIARFAQPLTSVRLGCLGNACEAVTVSARNSHIFQQQRLDAQLVPYESEDALIAAIDAGTIDAASLNLPALLTPLEDGRRLRVTAGLHSGCLKVLARDVFAFNTPADLKGNIIATDRLHGPSMNLLSAILRKQGIDPRHDVMWRQYSAPALVSALRAKRVNCVTVSDPLGYRLLTDHEVEPYLDTDAGGFSCGDDIATGHQCFLVVAGGLVERHPLVAAALTRAYLDGSAAIGRGVRAAALAEVYGPFAADLDETLGMLSSYDWNASTEFVLEELELTARDFRRAGLLRAATDPIQLAQHAFADVLNR